VSRELGSVTAELAVALPAVVLVLACCLSAVQVAGQQLQVQDAAAQAVRALARGGDPGIASRLIPGSTTEQYSTGDLVCATVSVKATALVGTLASITLAAHSCALGGGQ
jgi:Flp pilus assembly protein TadG